MYHAAMTAALQREPIPVDDYLAGELVSTVKHEYLGGVVYAVAGGTNVHNLIAGNLFGYLHERLRKGSCRPYNSDTKIRLRFPTHVRFYYPDVSVICRPGPAQESFQDDPAAIFEAISRQTRRIDEGEKREGYLSLGSLLLYLLVEQEGAHVVVHRRTEQGFERKVYSGLDAVIPLPEFQTELPLAEIYEGVDFVPEPVEDEGHA